MGSLWARPAQLAARVSRPAVAATPQSVAYRQSREEWRKPAARTQGTARELSCSDSTPSEQTAETVSHPADRAEPVILSAAVFQAERRISRFTALAQKPDRTLTQPRAARGPPRRFAMTHFVEEQFSSEHFTTSGFLSPS